MILQAIVAISYKKKRFLLAKRANHRYIIYDILV